MKCSKCSHEWQLIGHTVDMAEECPKCHKKIIINYKSFSSISEGIYYCILKGGTASDKFAILKNKTRLSSYLDDVLGSNYPERSLIKLALDCSAIDIIYDAANDNSADKNKAFKQASEQIVRSFSMDPAKANEIIGYFTDALGWKINKNISPNVSKNAPVISTETTKGGNATVASSGTTNGSNAAVMSGTTNSGNASIGSNNINRTEFNQNAALSPNTVNRSVVNANTSLPAANSNQASLPTNVQLNKKSHWGCLLFVIILLLLLIAAALLWFLLRSQDNSEPVRLPESSSEIVSESEIDVSTEAVIETTTVEATTAIESTAESATIMSTEATTEETTEVPAEAAVYTVTNLCSVTELKPNGSSEICYDAANQKLYYQEGNYKLSCYDLNTSQKETVLDISEKQDYIQTFSVNPFNGKPYAVLKYAGLYDVFEDKILTSMCKPNYRCFTFLSENEAVILNRKFDLNTGDMLFEGYLPEYLYSSQPFLHGNEYYYFSPGDPGRSTRIVKTTQILTSDGSYSDGVTLDSKYCKAYFVDTDDLYYMDQNNSIYRYDVEAHLSADSNGFLNSDKNPDELLIDGSEIENTGIAYLSDDITEITRISDSCFIVFDKMDKTIKMVGTPQINSLLYW